MQEKNQKTDVIVVGAGPVGLSLALGLAREGLTVAVFEKKSALSPHSRAPAVWPKTQEILADLGVIGDFFKEGKLIRDMRFWDADSNKKLFSLPLHELQDETVFPQLLVIPQEKTEAVLLQALKHHPNAAVHFGTEVTSLVQEPHLVEVSCRNDGGESHHQSAFLVGCDGAHSFVREAMGIPDSGFTYGVKAALADIALDEPQDDLPFPRFSNKEILAVAILIDKNLWRLILPFSPNDSLALDDRIAQAAAQLFPASTYRKVWQSDFKLHNRVSKQFVSGRIAIAGDAAHLNSPVGGQGMNSGIQDTVPLRRALLRAVYEDNPNALKAYDLLRRTRVERGVNRFTDHLTRVLLARNGQNLKPVLKAASYFTKFAGPRRALMRSLAMLR